MKLLNGKVALVTGGTAGIGAAIARCFVNQGAHVIILGTNMERGTSVAQELNAIPEGAGCTFYPVNVAKSEEVDAVTKKIMETHGTINILVNNAGITRDQLLMKMSEEEFDDVMDVNVKSCYLMSKAWTRPFLKAKGGRIINMSSIVGLVGNTGQANYAASKAAVIGLTKSLAKELASRQILVNCIAPGYINTPMTDKLAQGQKDAILPTIPLGRMGSPDDIANAALFLASEMSSYITGQTIIVDGGMVM